MFNVNGTDVNFNFSDLPNDMKMPSFLGGELNNACNFTFQPLLMYPHLVEITATSGNHGIMKECQ